MEARRTAVLQRGESLPLCNRALSSNWRKSPAHWRSAIRGIDQIHGGQVDRHDTKFEIATKA